MVPAPSRARYRGGHRFGHMLARRPERAFAPLPAAGLRLAGAV